MEPLSAILVHLPPLIGSVDGSLLPNSQADIMIFPGGLVVVDMSVY